MMKLILPLAFITIHAANAASREADNPDPAATDNQMGYLRGHDTPHLTLGPQSSIEFKRCFSLPAADHDGRRQVPEHIAVFLHGDEEDRSLLALDLADYIHATSTKLVSEESSTVCQKTDYQWGENDSQYLHVGFGCKEDGMGIQLGVFLDDDCSIYLPSSSNSNKPYDDALILENFKHHVQVVNDKVLDPFSTIIHCSEKIFSGFCKSLFESSSLIDVNYCDEENKNSEDWKSSICDALKNLKPRLRNDLETMTSRRLKHKGSKSIKSGPSKSVKRNQAKSSKAKRTKSSKGSVMKGAKSTKVKQSKKPSLSKGSTNGGSANGGKVSNCPAPEGGGEVGDDQKGGKRGKKTASTGTKGTNNLAQTPTFNPTPSPTKPSEMINITELEPALLELFKMVQDLSSFEILNEPILLLGSSINSLIGGEAGNSSIASILDLRNFVADTTDRYNASVLDINVVCQELGAYLKKDGELGSQSSDQNDTVPAATMSDLCDGSEEPVTVDVLDGGGIQIKFCSRIEFDRITTLSGDEIFDPVKECVELETSACGDVAAQLDFSARLTIDPDPLSPLKVEIDQIHASVRYGGTPEPEFSLFVGLLELDCLGSEAAASASFSLTFCDVDEPGSSCKEDEIGPQIEGSKFYLSANGNYELHGECTKGDVFPGLRLNGPGRTASFQVVEDSMYPPTPQYEIKGFRDEDFVAFCPSDVVYFLRTIDSTFIRTQENSALQTELPLTSTSYTKTLGTGNILLSQLLKYFLQVQDFEERPTKSLSLIEILPSEEDDILPEKMLPADESNLEFFFVISDLDANPEDTAAVRVLANKTNGICAFTLPASLSQDIRDDLKQALVDGITDSDCEVTACDFEASCEFDLETGDYLCPDTTCDIVVGTNLEEDEDDEVVQKDALFIASVGSNEDVTLIGLYHSPSPDKQPAPEQKELFRFPLNLPVTPGLVPRFRNFNDLAGRIEQAISNKPGNDGVSVDFEYARGNVEPSRFNVAVSFKRETELEVGVRFAADDGFGDLGNIRVDVDSSSTTVSVTAEYTAELVIVLAPNKLDDIVIFGFACNEKDDACSVDPVELQLEYFEGDSNVITDLQLDGTGSPLSVLRASDLAGVANITQFVAAANRSLLEIRFIPSIDSLNLRVRKDCVDPLDETDIVPNVLECAENKKVRYLENSYGLRDENVSRKPFYIAIKYAGIGAVFGIEGQERLFATLDEVVEVQADLFISLSGDLSFSVGSTGLLPFNNWLIGVNSIENETSPDGLVLQTSSSFSSNSVVGDVEALAPFDNGEFRETVEGSVQQFDVAFFGQSSALPISFDVSILRSLRELSFANIVGSLSKVIKIVIGDGQNQTLESCSGGMLANDLVSYDIPVIGLSACDSARFLQVVPNAIDALSQTSGTISSLYTMLEALLNDGFGEDPIVTMIPSNEDLILKLELRWAFQEKVPIYLDLAEILRGTAPDLQSFTKTAIPFDDEGTLNVEEGLVFRLNIAMEPAGDQVNTYILAGTGFDTSFAVDEQFRSFRGSLGPFTSNLAGSFGVGTVSSPLGLSVNIDSRQLVDESLSQSIDNIVKASFDGPVVADFDLLIPSVDLASTFNFEIQDLERFSSGSIILDPPSFNDNFTRVDSLFEILRVESSTFADVLDDVLRKVGEATFGSEGILSSFRIPFVRTGPWRALGATTENNIIDQLRRDIMPEIRNSLRKATDGLEVGDRVKDALQASDFLQSGEDVAFECFGDNPDVPTADCSNPQSIMWTLPVGREFEIGLPIDFSLNSKFPLEVYLELEEDLSLVGAWNFDLRFGFDMDEGFFVCTTGEKSEFSIQIALDGENLNFGGSMFFLSAELSDIDLTVVAGAFLDILSDNGRLTRSDFRKIRDKRALFNVGALAGAALKTNVSLKVDLEDVSSWIPALTFDLEAQFLEEIGSISSQDIATMNHRRELFGGHRVSTLSRLLAEADISDLDDIGLIPSCPLGTGKACAQINNVALGIETIEDFVRDTLGKVTEYLEPVVEPLRPLFEPLPGISDIAKKDITVLDIARVFAGESSGFRSVADFVETADNIIMLADDLGGLAAFSLVDGNCNLLDDFPGKCIPSRRRLGTTCVPAFDFCDKLPEGMGLPVLCCDPWSILDLLRNEDITLVTFRPPVLKFAFEKEYEATVYTPPTVNIGAGFEFAAKLEVDFALDTKGIREAVTQGKPEKAFNSFALVDSFKGVDKPMITLRGSVFLSVSVSAVIVEVGVSGGLSFIAEIDLFDPNPEQSRGLIRPYEIITTGMENPKNWLEFTFRIELFVRLFVKIRIKILWKKITLYKFSKTFTEDLVPPLRLTPKGKDPIAKLDLRTGTIELMLEAGEMNCTSLLGSLGDEVIECVSDGGVYNSFSNVKQLGEAMGSPAGSLEKVTLQNVQSPTTLNLAVNDELVLDYKLAGGTIRGSLFVGGGQVIAGPSPVTFVQLSGDGKIVLPEPEEQSLFTTFGDCSHSWTLDGHSNVRIDAKTIQGNCMITSLGGNYSRASLIIDFGFEEFVSCEDGYIVEVSSPERDSEDNLHASVEISRPDMADASAIIEVGPSFDYIQIKMSNCDDRVVILGGGVYDFCPLPDVTPIRRDLQAEQDECPLLKDRTDRTVSIYGGGGDDEIIVGRNDTEGLTYIPYSVIVDGGEGHDTLIVNDIREPESSLGNRLDTLDATTLSFFNNAICQCDLSNGTKKDFNITGHPLPLEYFNVEKLVLNTNDNLSIKLTAPGTETIVNSAQSCGLATTACQTLEIEDSQGRIAVILSGGGGNLVYLRGLGNGHTAAFFDIDGQDGDSGDAIIVPGIGDSEQRIELFQSSTIHGVQCVGTNVTKIVDCEGPYIDPPSASPSDVPSTSPTISTVPSFSPSSPPSSSPSTSPSVSIVPSTIPTLTPSEKPSE